jgi:hypothetical protein
MGVIMPECIHCKATEITSTTMCYDSRGMMLGEWPLYYVGNPTAPHLAEKYFCDVYCANAYYKQLTK